MNGLQEYHVYMSLHFLSRKQPGKNVLTGIFLSCLLLLHYFLFEGMPKLHPLLFHILDVCQEQTSLLSGIRIENVSIPLKDYFSSNNNTLVSQCVWHQFKVNISVYNISYLFQTHSHTDIIKYWQDIINLILKYQIYMSVWMELIKERT